MYIYTHLYLPIHKHMHIYDVLLPFVCCLWYVVIGGCMYVCVYIYVYVYVCVCVCVNVSVRASVSVITHCNTLQHTATHCHIFNHSATHYYTLYHTAAHCNTLPRI